MLRLEGVKSGYGRIEALKGIDLKIASGETVTLIGANGAGKTTTLMTISGMIKPTAGEIYFQGEPIGGKSPEEIVKAGIVHVPEGRRIFPKFTVLENIQMGAYLRNNKAEIKRDLDYVFDLFPILTERKKQIAGTLSGGEQQMLAISRALMAQPKLLLLDEPSLGLAPLIIRQIFEIIKKINKTHQTTIFLIEQNASLALKSVDRAYIMENGLIVASGSASELAQSDEIQKAYLGI
ncbi:MAG: ABC transporter ATP-binding protein [SAR324 cluster bacterium]|nr:ABC transporter ATP-binding protein [SAR324 cluster bacterium]